MCLAIPGKILTIAGEDLERTARVDFGGIIKDIHLAYTPQAQEGDHILVHVGFAISVIDADEAARVFRHLESLEQPADGEVL